MEAARRTSPEAIRVAIREATTSHTVNTHIALAVTKEDIREAIQPATPTSANTQLPSAPSHWEALARLDLTEVINVHKLRGGEA